MTPTEFIAKWQANTRAERAASQEHFIDLCRLLDEDTPNTDPSGANYAFEKGASKATGRDGWADVWRKDRFAWEYKGKHKDLDAAYRQLQNYVGALGNPPLLIVSDIERIVIRTNFNGVVTERHDILLADLADPARLTLLKHAFSDPEKLRPAKTRAGLTQDAAKEFTELARRLRERGHAAETVAHFVNRLVFCLFADDVDLLPKGLFEKLLTNATRRPDRFARMASELFGAMAQRDSFVGVEDIAWFNGGLFDDATALPLEKDDIALLRRAAEMDWSEIDPSIFGTLFERGLDPDKRSQLGAHYTDAAKIELIIDPVIRRPLSAEWESVKAEITALLAERTQVQATVAHDTTPGALQADVSSSESARARRKMREAGRKLSQRATELYNTATTRLRDFLARLRAFRVLDPACGSGNFLYLSLLALKDLEHRVTVEAEILGLQRETLYVGPEAVLGIEINPFAAELARVSMWIGHIQWARRHGYPLPADPVLRPMDHIECRDAVLNPDGTRAVWPQADVIVGNPPFLGDKAMRGILGDDYTERLRRSYEGDVPGAADLVCFWFEKARTAVTDKSALRVGLIATQSIRKGASRMVLDRITETGTIFDAWDDEPWIVDGALVRVSLVCFGLASAPTTVHLDAKEVRRIAADLTADQPDITQAISLQENADTSFIGTQKTGPFEIDGDDARRMLLAPVNPNGQPNSLVVRPWANADALTDRWPDKWIVDFGVSLSEREAAFFALPYQHVSNSVRPVRTSKREERANNRWWLFQRPRPAMRAAIANCSVYIATPRVAKHRLFVYLHPTVVPDTRLVVIARDDMTTFGVLHSRFHEIWALAQASRHGVGNDPTYNTETCFETFPFPGGLTPNIPATAYATNPHAQAIAAAARDLVEKRDLWLNPPELVRRVPEVVPGFPDRVLPADDKAAAILKKRTLTNLYNTRGTPEGAWLDNLHRTLDEAVAAAYGWPATLTDDEILERLLALNLARAGTGKAG